MLPTLLIAGFLAGIANAFVGGGSLMTVPALLAAGVPTVAAAASSTVALFPAALASAWVYRHDLRGLEGIDLAGLMLVTIAGRVAGAVLLVETPERLFIELTPWLLAAGALVFALGQIGVPEWPRRVRLHTPASLLLQLLIALYSGYFGGGVGILILAMLSLAGVRDLKQMNAVRVLLFACLYTVAVITFVAGGAVHWREVLAMLAAATAGGAVGALLARRLDQRLVAALTLVGAAVITALLFRSRG